MQFRLSGRIEWLVDGDPVPIGRRRERVLLALLLLDTGRLVRTDRLIELLWDGDEPPASARSCLQVHLSRLRSRLKDVGTARHGFTLSASGAGYTLHGDPHAVDVHRVRALWQRAERSETAEECVTLLDRALAEWRGPLLGDSVSDQLARRVGAGLNEMLRSATTLRAEARLALGRTAAASEELAGMIAAHPYDERVATLRMVALSLSGRRGEALCVYHEMRHRLASELGLEPGHELRRAQEMVLRADPALHDRFIRFGRPDGTGTGPPPVPAAGPVPDTGCSPRRPPPHPVPSGDLPGRFEDLRRLTDSPDGPCTVWV